MLPFNKFVMLWHAERELIAAKGVEYMSAGSRI